MSSFHKQKKLPKNEQNGQAQPRMLEWGQVELKWRKISTE